MSGTANPAIETTHKARDLIRLAGGVEAAAAIIGKGKSQVGRFQSVHEPDVMSIEDAISLEAATIGKPGHPVMTRHMARRSGHALIKLPHKPATASDLLDLIGEVSAECGDLIAGLLAGVRNGDFSGDQQIAIREQIADLIEFAVAIDVSLDSFAGEGNDG